MARLFSIAVVAALALAGGCLPSDFMQSDPAASNTPLVQPSTLDNPVPVVSRTSFLGSAPPSSADIGLPVDSVGKKLIAANPSLGMKPIFLAVGSPVPEIFHQNTSAVIITEGLIRQCKTEAQLAAVLSWELGRMVSEREVLASPETHNPERQPPIAMTMGNSGQFSGLDQLQLAETVKMSGDRRRPSKKFVPPDPQVLARRYLECAGYDKRELDNAAPLLAQAEKNFIIEKQFKGSPEAASWSPK